MIAYKQKKETAFAVSFLRGRDKKKDTQKGVFYWCARRDLNPHARSEH